MDILEQLEWRYATKKFDATKKVEPATLDRIIKATSLSASSYGLQPYKIIVVENPEVRERLKAVSWGQPQITDASHLVVLARVDPLRDIHVKEFVDNIVQTRGVTPESLAEYNAKMMSAVYTMDAARAATWTSKQAYIALGTLLVAAAAEGVDTCPMEGFDASQYDEILGLKEKNLAAVVIAAVGYRAEDDAYQHLKKVRKPMNELVELV